MTAPKIDRRHTRMATCVHEAGHTTANLVLGLAFVKVRILADDAGVVEDRQVPDGWEFADAVASAAGYAAEVRWIGLCGVIPDEHKPEMIDLAYPAAEHDLANVRRQARRAGVAVSTVRNRAHTLVAENWGPLMRTANALYKARTMSQAKVKRVARI
jgi:hypothetical protein